MILALALLATLLPQSPAPRPSSSTGDAWRIVREVQRAIETGSSVPLERAWRTALTRAPRDPRALLGEASIYAMRYQYERADSLYREVLTIEHSPSAYAAAARLGMAAWRATGADVAGADRLFSEARDEANRVGDRRMAFDAVIGLSALRGRRAGPRAALALVTEARALAVHPDDVQAAQLLCRRGALTEQLGDTTGRNRLFDGIGLARRAGERGTLAVCLLLLAQTGERGGYFEDAEGRASEAVRLFERIHRLPGVAAASQWLGYLRLKRGKFAVGRTDLERAVEAAETTRYTTVDAWAHADLADLYVALGDNEAAQQHSERAIALHTATGDLWGLAIDLQLQGRIAQARRQVNVACARYAASVAAFKRAGLAFNAVASLRLLALAEMSAGHLDSAARALGDATQLARASGNAGWATELPVHRARLAMLRNDLQEADSLMASARPQFMAPGDSAKLTALEFAVIQAQLALRLHRVASADSTMRFIAAAITQQRRAMMDADLRAGLAQLRGHWTAGAGGLSESYPELVAGLVANGRLGSAFQFIESVRAREITEAALRRLARMNGSSVALAGFRRLMAPGYGGTMTLDEVRRRLSADAALVTLTLGRGTTPTTAIVVTRTGATSVSLPSREVVEPLIDRYLRVISAGAEPVALGRRLGEMLLDPIVRALPPGVTRLDISPDGELFRAPFDALRLSDGHYAVERYTIALVPSGTAVRALRAMPAAEDATTLVAVGDPDFDGGRRARALAPFDGVVLSRLPRSAEEARRVARYARTGFVLTGAGATESALHAIDWHRVGIVHFATHALVDDESQARTALALTRGGRAAADDGFLTAAEIAALRLNGPLVVLSACESIGGQILGGEGLRGLAGPLFEAGARAIVLTDWSIGDASVLSMMDHFYAALASGARVGDALREAKMAAMREGGRVADWGAFTVIGDASMRVTRVLNAHH